VTPPALDVVEAVRLMAALLMMRLLPFAAYVVFRPESKTAARVAWLTGYAAVVGLACRLGLTTNVVIVLLASLYYLAVAAGVCRLPVLVSAGRVTRGGLFAIVVFVFLFLPGVLLPQISATVFLVVGWDLVLSSYSYCVETSRPGFPPPSLGEGLFFLLVNPTLVYTARGRRLATDGGAAGCIRAAIGVAALFADFAVLGPVAKHLRERELVAPHTKATLLFELGYGVARFAEVYAAQSGLASLRIGLMRQIGWFVPECYRYPAAATSPIDFWRRWNIYVRTWLEAYVFLPLARRIARRSRSRGRTGPIVAAAVTLVVSGAFHVAYAFAGTQSIVGASLNPFIAAGAFVTVWSLLTSPARSLRARLDAARARSLDRASHILGWGTMTAALVCAAVVWG
jgi:hypothetical protein